MIGMVDESLKISFQMCPAPLRAAHAPIHFRPVAIHDASEGVCEQFLKDCRGPSGSQRENRICACDECPQPRFELSLFRRRFVDSQHRFARQLGRQFVIDRRQRGHRLILQLDHPARRTRLIQYLFQEQGDAALALFEASHEQRGQGDQSWSRLTVRHTRREFPTGRDAAARTVQAVALIFRDLRLDLGDFPDLVPERFDVVSGQGATAQATRRRLQADNLMTLLGRNQRPFVLGMPRLSASFLATLLLLRSRFSMGMLGARRQRRISRRFFQLGFQVRNLLLQFSNALLVMVDHGLQQRPKTRVAGPPIALV